MKIYTKRGDSGKTDLASGERMNKDDTRIEAYGTIDELNSIIGLIGPTKYEDIDKKLNQVQNHLHIIQAQLSRTDGKGVRIESEQILMMEEWIDEYEDELEPLIKFILPGGSEIGAKLHNSRTVCRRAERRVVTLLIEKNEVGLCIEYLNRLSDAMFIFARVVNKREGIEEESPIYK
jgi:cob(I)alamin adenosyltransferase